MIKSKTFLVAFLAIALVFSSGCVMSFKRSMLKQAEEAKYTKDEQKVIHAISYRYKFGKEKPNGDGFEINYQSFPNELVTKSGEDRLEDLDYVLNPSNPEWGPYIKELGLRDELEKEEERFKAVHGRLILVDNYNKFQELIGESNYYRPQNDRGYDAKKVFAYDPKKEFPFTVNRIEDARMAGYLKQIEKLVWFSDRTLDRKEPDPSFPDDPNRFVWKTREAGMEFVLFKIVDRDKPNDNNVDYVEGTRVWLLPNGIKRESEPVLKFFVSNNRAVLLIDKDKEGETGFGLPDFVESVYRISRAQELVNEEILSRLFYESSKKKRELPKDLPPIKVEIAPVMSAKVDVWEVNLKGWRAPSGYKNRNSDNYTVSIKIKGSERNDFDPLSRTKQIQFFKKTWDGDGDVSEYFYPKPPLDGTDLIRAEAYNKEFFLVTGEGETINGFITPETSKFIQDKPFALEFTEGGRKWFILDENGDGIYEKRRELALGESASGISSHH